MENVYGRFVVTYFEKKSIWLADDCLLDEELEIAFIQWYNYIYI